MKTMIAMFTVLSGLNALAATEAGILCSDDRRLENGGRGPLTEILLTPDVEGYRLQSQYIPTRNSSDIVVETLADKLTCLLDDKLAVAYCENQTGQNVVQVKEVRKVFYDSLGEDAKKKTQKTIDFSILENGIEKKNISFAVSDCQTFGADA